MFFFCYFLNLTSHFNWERNPVSGPAGELMKTQQLPVSIAGVAQAYQDFLDALIADERDRPHAAEVEKLGIHVTFTNAIMDSDNAKAELARAAVAAIIPARAGVARDGVDSGRAR